MTFLQKFWLALMATLFISWVSLVLYMCYCSWRMSLPTPGVVISLIFLMVVTGPWAYVIQKCMSREELRDAQEKVEKG